MGRPETRDKLQTQLSWLEESINAEDEAMERMNEEKMIRALNYNVKLGGLQNKFDRLASKVLERKTLLENKKRQKTRKRLVINSKY